MVCPITQGDHKELECGPMPNLMVALPNIGGALCSTPQSLADAQYQMPCSNAAKTRNPLKFAEVPQTTGWISAVSRPQFTILWGHVEDISLLNNFFPIVDMCLSCEDIARQIVRWCPDGDFWRLFCVLHVKFALRPHHVWKYGRHPIYGR